MTYKNIAMIIGSFMFLLFSHGCFADSNILTDSEKSFLKNLFEKHQNNTQKIDAVRQFVYNNSKHEEPFDKDKWNSELMIKMMIRNYKEKSNSRPHMTCGPRALSMQYILNLIEIKSFKVQVYTDNMDSFLSHTFLHVYNNDTNRWEVHDPDYNLIYLDEKGNRIEVQDLIFTKLDEIMPYYDDGKKTIKGWNSSNIILKDNYFEAVMLWGSFTNGSSLLIINQKRFNPYQEKKDYTLTNKQKVNFLQWCDSVYRSQWNIPFYVLLR